MDEAFSVFGAVVVVALLGAILLAVFLAGVNDKLGRIADALEKIAGTEPPVAPDASRSQD